MKFSLIVSTLGRVDTFEKFFASLEQQTVQDFELILVDQNDDDRVRTLITRLKPSFLVRRIHTPEQRGLSRGRNVGANVAVGDLLLFPDDDCWYPPNFLEKALHLFDRYNADILTGRACDEMLRSINGRFEATAQKIDRRNVWTTQIEWVCFFKRSVLTALNGYDEGVGVGSDGPWQACEGQEIVLRAIESGFCCYFDPDLYGHHEELNVTQPDSTMQSKGAAYARGFGHVARIHGYSLWFAVYWSLRPLAKVLMNSFRLNLKAARYSLGVSRGRMDGYLRSKKRADQHLGLTESQSKIGDVFPIETFEH